MSISRLLQARGVDTSSYEIVCDQRVLDEAANCYPRKTRDSLDISAFSDEDLASTMRNYLVEGDIYLLWWDFKRGAIHISGAALAAQISDLWRPSSDDVVIFDKAMHPVVLIDHEEHLYLV